MKQVHKNFFISYILSDRVWWCNIKQFLSYSKNYTCKFMQANSWHHKLFHFHLSFWIWKVWKGREKITNNLNICRTKGVLDEIKNIFHSFWRAIVWWKNKNLTKNSGHKLKKFVNHFILPYSRNNKKRQLPWKFEILGTISSGVRVWKLLKM